MLGILGCMEIRAWKNAKGYKGGDLFIQSLQVLRDGRRVSSTFTWGLVDIGVWRGDSFTDYCYCLGCRLQVQARGIQDTNTGLEELAARLLTRLRSS